MEAIRQIVRIPDNHELRIKIPDHVAEDDLLEVIFKVKCKKICLFLFLSWPDQCSFI